MRTFAIIFTEPSPEAVNRLKSEASPDPYELFMGLQQSVGEFTGKLDVLIETVGEQSKKVDGLAEKVGEMRGGLNVARWFIGTLIAIGVLIGGLLWRLPAIIEALRGG